MGNTRFELPLNPKAVRKHPSAWTVLGTPVDRLDGPALVTGRFEFVHNVRVDGMLHGRVVRPPAIGSTVARVDEASIRDLAGVVRVVVKDNFVAVVAEKPWPAMQAAEKLEVSWTPGVKLPEQQDFYRYLRQRTPRQDSLAVDSVMLTSGWPAPRRCSRPPTSIPTRCTARSARRAP